MAAERQKRGRRCRLRVRTLIRWLTCFESTPVRDNECLLRAVPNQKNYYQDTLDIPVQRVAFEPHKRRDPDGMSFFREDFATPEEVAAANRHPDGCRIVRLRMWDLIDRWGLTAIPDPLEAPEPAGHVIIPAMNYAAYKADPRKIEAIGLGMARLVGKEVAYGPTPPKPKVPQSSH